MCSETGAIEINCTKSSRTASISVKSLTFQRGLGLLWIEGFLSGTHSPSQSIRPIHRTELMSVFDSSRQGTDRGCGIGTQAAAKVMVLDSFARNYHKVSWTSRTGLTLSDAGRYKFTSDWIHRADTGSSDGSGIQGLFRVMNCHVEPGRPDNSLLARTRLESEDTGKLSGALPE